MLQRTVALPRPREPVAAERLAPGAASGAGPVPRPPQRRSEALRLGAVISADGRAHPSDAVRRYNWAVPDGQDPFIRHYFGVLAAFGLGAARARRAAMADEKADTWERRFGRLVKAAREAAGLSQSRLEDLAGLGPPSVAQVERGDLDLPVSELADLAHALGVDPGSLFPPAAGPQRPGHVSYDH